MSWLSRAARRLARSGIAKVATVALKATPLGAAAFRVGHAAKQLGATALAGRLAKRQSTALNAAVAGLANAKRPSIVHTPSGRSADAWIKEATSPDLPGTAGDLARHKRRAKSTSVRATKPKRSALRGSKGSAPAAKAAASGNGRASSKPRKTRTQSSSTRPKRELPAHMRPRAEHMKKLGARYKAEGGKAGTGMAWLDFVKANPFKG